MTLYWPIALIVLSNVFYHICSKATPSSINPFASLTVTYGVAFVLCVILYFATVKGGQSASGIQAGQLVQLCLWLNPCGAGGGLHLHV